eukprot:793881-Pelagomonas_calceolata.AAC.1
MVVHFSQDAHHEQITKCYALLGANAHARYDLYTHEVITLGRYHLRALSPMARAKVLTHARFDLHTHEVITLGGYHLHALSPMARAK